MTSHATALDPTTHPASGPTAAGSAQELLGLQEPPAADLWLRDPQRAHRQWRGSLILANRGYAEHSNRLYEALFGRFVVWMVGRGLSLRTLTAAQIETFLDTLQGRGGAESSVRTRRTYLSEISRVLDQMQALELRRSNPAAELIDMMRLKEPLRERNIQLAGVENLGARIGELLRDAALDAAAKPSEVRAAAMVALALDAGLTLKEIQRLTWSRFTAVGVGDAVLGKVNTAGHRTLKGRELELSGWAAQILQAWAALRVQQQQACTPGAVVPPDKLRGLKLFAHPRKAHALRDVTIQADVKAALAAVGAPEVGPAVLRNEFIANLLRLGKDADQVRELAGLRDTAQITLLREAARIPRAPLGSALAEDQPRVTQ
jgi:site-specific recombinase XerD